ANAARRATRPRLRAHELEKAPPRGERVRPLLLRMVVHRVGRSPCVGSAGLRRRGRAARYLVATNGLEAIRRPRPERTAAQQPGLRTRLASFICSWVRSQD